MNRDRQEAGVGEETLSPSFFIVSGCYYTITQHNCEIWLTLNVNALMNAMNGACGSPWSDCLDPG